jgi:hypothetical protein
MLPKPIPALPKEATERFEAQDKEPLPPEDKAFLRDCLETYRKKPVKA